MNCIEWKKSKTKDGYGITYEPGKYTLVHRYTWEQHNGLIPQGMVIRHKCDNPSCYKIEHLELGTRKQNTQDMLDRKRASVGSAHPISKLTEQDVLDIRASKLSCEKLARMYNCNSSNIHHIKTKKTWRHV